MKKWTTSRKTTKETKIFCSVLSQPLTVVKGSLGLWHSWGKENSMLFLLSFFKEEDRFH